MSGLTQKRLKVVLYYHPESGDFVWLEDRKFTKTGDQAGNADKDGYKILWLDNRAYRCGRLAWFYMTGSWPENEIDHRDSNRANDSWGNLRPGSRAQNSRNRKIHVTSRTGFKGVGFHKSSGMYRARIGGRHLGLFDDPKAAHQAYVMAAVRQNGDFANGG